jgi:DnaK suppressor protein
VTKRFDKKDKEQFKKQLRDKKFGIIHKLSKVIDESKEMESNVAQDAVDKAETSYTKEFLLSLSDADREQLVQIDEALRRLEHDEFGLCQQCGKEISRKRLEAIPWAQYCISCQEKIEAESKSG